MRLKQPEGYFMRDDRLSGGQLLESATVTCSHCQRVVILNPDRSRPRGFCRKCNHYICDGYACNFECIPLDKVFDDLQESAFKQELRNG